MDPFELLVTGAMVASVIFIPIAIIAAIVSAIRNRR